jgi:hypothetical protein
MHIRCLKKKLPKCFIDRAMADICITLKTNLVDVYITLKRRIGNEFGIIAIWF